MSDYIRRADAINILCGECLNYKVCCSADGEIPACPLFWKMQSIPAADVVKRKRGEWVVDDEFIDCSACREEKWSKVPFGDLVKRFRFCPNCGADMRGTDDN